jgi:hypothetical protein
LQKDRDETPKKTETESEWEIKGPEQRDRTLGNRVVGDPDFRLWL